MNVPGRRNSQCKSPEVKRTWPVPRDSKKSSQGCHCELDFIFTWCFTFNKYSKKQILWVFAG